MVNAAFGTVLPTHRKGIFYWAFVGDLPESRRIFRISIIGDTNFKAEGLPRTCACCAQPVKQARRRAPPQGLGGR